MEEEKHMSFEGQTQILSEACKNYCDKEREMSVYFEYKFSLKLTATSKTGMELSGIISEKAKDAILKAIMTDDRERTRAALIQEKPTTMGMEYAANFESAEKLLEKKEWVGLTWDDTPRYMSEEFIQGARWAEATLKGENCG